MVQLPVHHTGGITNIGYDPLELPYDPLGDRIGFPQYEKRRSSFASPLALLDPRKKVKWASSLARYLAPEVVSTVGSKAKNLWRGGEELYESALKAAEPYSIKALSKVDEGTKIKPTAKLNADDFFAARDNLAKKLGRNPTREELMKELDITTSALDHKITRLGIRDELNLSTAERPGGASVTVKRIEEMNEVSKNFHPKDWTTWRGSVMVKKFVEDGKETRRFVFPDDPKVKQAIVKEINEIKGKVRGGSGGGLGELANLLDIPYGNFTAAVRNLQKETKLISDWKKSDYSQGTKFRQKLDSAWRKANPEASKELNLLKREVKKLNDELGLTGDNAFEVDHIRAVVDDFENTLKQTGVGVADFSIKNVQIIPKFVNAGGVKRVGQTLTELPDAKSKMVLFENAKFGIRKLYSDLSKKGLSRTEKADILREIKNKWSQWEKLTKEHNILFDFTDYKGKLPEKMLVKNKPDDFDAFNQLYDIADDLIGKRAAGVREEYIESLLSKGGRVGFEPGGQVHISGSPDEYDISTRGDWGPFGVDTKRSTAGGNTEAEATLRFYKEMENIDGLILKGFISKKEGEDKKWLAEAEYENEIAEGLTLSGYVSKRQDEEKEWLAKAEYENELANNLYFNAYGQTDGNEDKAGVSLTKYFKQGGRAGYREGGTVKPKINPANYIEYYRDGTKLYKINSFIRDIARQID